MFCRECGKEIEDNAQFCRYCGSPVEMETQESWEKQPDRNTLEWTENFNQSVYQPENKKKWWIPVCIAAGVTVLVVLGVFAANMIRTSIEKTQKAEWMKPEKGIAEIAENQESAEIAENQESAEIKANKDVTETDEENKSEVTAQEEEEENLQSGMGTVSIQEFQLSASSVLQEAGYDYNVGALLDMDAQTCWAEGVSGTGEGQSITFSSEEAKVVSGLAILPGFLKSSDIFYKNGMPVEIEITSADKVWTRSFYDFQPNFLSPMDSMVFIDFGEDVKIKECTVTLTRCKSGNKYDDICITEMFLYKK